MAYIDLKWFKTSYVEKLQKELSENNGKSRLYHTETDYWTLLPRYNFFKNNTEYSENIHKLLVDIKRDVTTHVEYLKDKNEDLEQELSSIRLLVKSIIQKSNINRVKKTSWNKRLRPRKNIKY